MNYLLNQDAIIFTFMRIALLLLLSLMALHNRIFAQSNERVYTLSQFVFEDVNGKPFSLDSFKGKTVYVDCWFPDCPPCRKEMPYSKLLQQRLHTLQMDSNIVFITISFKQSKEHWLNTLQELQMTDGINLYAPASIFEGAFIITGFPTYRIFRPDGKMDMYDIDRPSTFGLTDFIIYAVSQGMTVNEAYQLEKNDRKTGFDAKHINSITNPVRKKFFTAFALHATNFWKDYAALKQKK